MKIECNSIQILTKSYFNKSMSPSIKDVVLSHIMNCKECQKFYKKYAKDIGLEFDVKKDSAVFILEGKTCERTKKEFDKKYGEDEIKDYELNWEYYAHKLDLKKLMNLKCVNDFTQETFEVDETDPMCIEAYTAFGRFVTMELCKKVDSLERCYNMEIKK